MNQVFSVQGACAAASIAATFYASQAVAIHTLGQVERAVRWTACAVVGICGSIAAFHLLSALGHFRLGDALAVIGLGTLGVRALTRVSVTSVMRLLDGDLRALLRFALGADRRLWPLRAALATAPCLVAARALILPPLGYDTLTYHGPKAAMWVQTGADLRLRMPGGWAMYRWYPYGGEILGAWAMLPFHDDTLYLWVDVALWLAWLPALAGLCAELGVSARMRPALCLYVMTIPAIYDFLPSGYVDVLVHFLALATLLFSLRAIAGKTPGASAGLALAASLTAITAKLTALALPAIAILVMLLALRTDRMKRTETLRGMLYGSGIGMLTLGPMLLRNIIGQGYPFSPYPLRLLGLTLGVAAPELRWFQQLAPEQRTFANEAHQLATILGFESPAVPSFGLASIPLLMLLGVGLARSYRRQRLHALLLALVIGSQIAAYLHSEFAVTRNLFGYVNARFFVLLPTLAALLVSQLWPTRRGEVTLSAYFIAASAASLWFYVRELISPSETAPLLVLLAIGWASLMLAAFVAGRVSAPIAGTAMLGALLVMLSCASQPLRDYRARLRYTALSTSGVGHRIPWYLSALAPLVDHPKQSHRIAFTAGPNKLAGGELMYYFMGSRLQNELIYVSPLPYQSLPIYDREQPRVPQLDARAWAARVQASGADYVVALSPTWYERTFMLQQPERFEPIGDNGVSWLFRVRKNEAPPRSAGAVSP